MRHLRSILYEKIIDLDSYMQVYMLYDKQDIYIYVIV